MADELNIPTHRWYQPRYNISLPNTDFSKQWIFNSGIQKIDAFIGGGFFSPSALFSLSESGVWFDPSDLTTLFQDPAGTTPVTAPGNTVGLMLDKSQGLALGAERVVEASSWTGSASWSVDVSTGTATATNTTTSADDLTIGSLNGDFVGQAFLVSCTVVSISSGSISIRSSRASAGGSISVPGVLSSVIYVTLTGGGSLLLDATTGTSAVVTNISVRELAGNHATQSVLASRPVYGIEPAGGRRNLLTWSEDFRNTAAAGETRPWNNTAATITPDFDGNADRYVGTGATTVSFQTIPAVAGQTKTFAIDVKNNGGTAFSGLRIRDVTSGLDIVAASNLFASINSSTYTRLTVTYVVPAGCTSVAVYPVSTVSVGTGVDILIRNAQDELGSTATPYQKVTTQHDVTEAGVASVGYLYFDGVNDAMVMSTITPGIDKAQVFAGVRKLSDAATAVVVELSVNAGSSSGAVGLFAPANAGADSYRYNSRGTVLSSAATGLSAVAPISNVVTGLGNISGDLTTIRVNGTQVAQSTTDQGTGNYLAYPLYIGARAGTSLFFTGHLYSLVVRFGANLDGTLISNTETWVAGKAGVTL